MGDEEPKFVQVYCNWRPTRPYSERGSHKKRNNADSMATALSPDSEKSIYFDAPIAQFSMPSSTPHPLVDAAAPAQDVDDVNDNEHDVIHRPESSSGWLPAVDLLPDSNGTAYKGISKPSSAQNEHNTNLRRSTSRRSLFTASDGQPIEGSTFIAGAATTGPHSVAQPDEEIQRRAEAANASLTPKQRSKIAKTEAKEAKRLSKIIKDEGRAEKLAFNIAVRELADLQELQASAIKTQENAHKARNKTQAELKNQETLFLAARARYQSAQARLSSQDEAIESVKESARIATERLQSKSQEVDSLRTMYAVDERERAARLSTMNGKQESNCMIV